VRAATEANQAPVATAAGVVRDVLRDVAVERVRIVSPYPPWLTQRCTEFWTASGYTVTGLQRVSADSGQSDALAYPIYAIGADAVSTELERAVDAAGSRSGAADAVIVAGTGVPTVAALDRIVGTTSTLLVSANLVAARWLLSEAGADAATATSTHPALAALGRTGR
jgi:maleate isomerase